MRIGIVSQWFNRGQGVVGRYLRSIYERLGHETFVLARPTKDSFDLPRFIDHGEVWDQPGITNASRHEIPLGEYFAWARDNFLDAACFDQNYQFETIAALRASGVKTIGRFVWEKFTKRDVRGAMKAFDVIYSLTRCEQLRYREFGIKSPLLRWGCPPELTALAARKPADTVAFFYPGGYLTHRKPTPEVVRSFSRIALPGIRLVLKVQRLYKHEELIGDRGFLDPRITVVAADMPADEYYDLFASCHVCLAPSRWEGLGLHLYEAVALGIPIITNDNPPMNETVVDRFNGLLVKSHACGRAKSGIPAFDPDLDDLSRAIESLSDRGLLAELSANARKMRELLAWENTIEDFRKLLESPEITRTEPLHECVPAGNAAVGHDHRF